MGVGKLCEVPDPGLASWGKVWSKLDAQWLHTPSLLQPWPRTCSRSCQSTY